MTSLNKGFSLLEMLVVITIIGIVVTFALPSYSQHIAKARRITAEAALMQLAGQMESYYMQHHSYEGATLEKLNTPELIAENNYRLTILSATISTFDLAAIPQKQQAKNDRCGELTFNSVGKKGATINTSECW